MKFQIVWVCKRRQWGKRTTVSVAALRRPSSSDPARSVGARQRRCRYRRQPIRCSHPFHRRVIAGWNHPICSSASRNRLEFFALPFRRQQPLNIVSSARRAFPCIYFFFPLTNSLSHICWTCYGILFFRVLVQSCRSITITKRTKASRIQFMLRIRSRCFPNISHVIFLRIS